MNFMSFGDSGGASLGASVGNARGTERAPSGLARFFGTSPIQDRPAGC